MRTSALLVLLAASVFAQSPAASAAADATGDPAYASLTKAFEALRQRDYDAAILSFRNAASLSPGRADIRENLAYTLLKTGETEAAREEFGEAMRIDPGDYHVALEYAFLCFEAKDDAPARKAEARRIFATVRDTGDAESRATAAAAFRNIDEPLRAGMERWTQALAGSAPTFSAYYELAQLAEQRDELELAATNYKAAFRLSPERKSVLLELARIETARGNGDGMMGALIAASRGPGPRAAELAREKLPARYPYVYEFRRALELDPSNISLHRELAYLLLTMSQSGQAAREDAEREFAALVASHDMAAPREGTGAPESPGAAGRGPCAFEQPAQATPPNAAERVAPPRSGGSCVAEDYISIAQLGLLYLEDQRTDLAMPLLNRVLEHGDEATANRVRMALHRPLVLVERKDAPPAADQKAPDARALAERSYHAGFLKDALRYFTQAREENPSDPALALKLGWTNNLLHDDATALRWFDVARQSDDPAIAAEANRAWRNLRPEQRRFRITVWLYPLFSSRWGDMFGYGQLKMELRAKRLPVHPYASVRLAGDVRRETSGPVPQALSESAFITALGVGTNVWHGANAWFEGGFATSYMNGNRWSDYRGGISFTRTQGAALGGERSGLFLETTGDSVFISHFDEDLINYAQCRLGYTRPLAGARVQAFWNQNFTVDVKKQYWANFMETGPGVRIHPPGMPPPMWINVSALRGVYLRNEGNPGRPNFEDVRVGIWYAFTR